MNARAGVANIPMDGEEIENGPREGFEPQKSS